ncbi:MAG: type II secretion system F family protein [Candidatus Diapherotrites archaeon]
MGKRVETWVNLFLESEKINNFENLLGIKLEIFVIENIKLGIIFSLISIGILTLLDFDVLYITGISFIFLILPLILKYSLAALSFERDKSNKELMVPDLLLQAPVFPKGTEVTRMIKYVGEADYGLLGNEFKTAYNEIQKGASVEEALLSIKNRCKSRVIDRAITLLIHGYKSGADMSQIFKETAEDILETNEILRERVSTLIIEKYTLIFAGGIIVPVILGLLSGMVSGMNFSIIEGLELGMSALERKEIFEAALFGTKIYIIEYAIIASLFIANQEGNIKNAILYAVVLVPLSFAAFLIAQGI